MVKKKGGTGKPAKLKVKPLYILAAVCAALFASGIFYNSQRQEFDGVRINLAGRQRMLTQKISRDTILYAYNHKEAHRVKTHMEVFETTLHALTYGGPAPMDLRMSYFRSLPPMDEPHIREKLEHIMGHWKTLKNSANLILEQKNTTGLDKLIISSEELLTGMNHIVFLIQEAAEKKHFTGYLLAYLGLFLVGLSGIIFLYLKIKRGAAALKNAAARIEKLETLLPICSNCKKIRSGDQDPSNMKSWQPVEAYFSKKDEVMFSHSMCPDCTRELYPEMADELLRGEENPL